jgi:putative lipase involved disintegration of autophagic bodies
LVELQDPGDEDNVVLVHQGFKEYLYGKPRRKHHLCKSSSHTSSEKEAHASKVETITNQVIELLDEYPGYMIYTTGHSLGGALCTLLAFELAGNDDERIPKPISCISFASPKVGNRKFANAFQVSECADDKKELRSYYITWCSHTCNLYRSDKCRRWRRKLSCVAYGYGTSVML